MELYLWLLWIEIHNSRCDPVSLYYAPIATSFPKSANENTNITFTAIDFTNNFSGGDSLIKIQILTLPTNGTLKLSTEPVAVNQEIATNYLEKLTFTPNTGWLGSTSFSWNGNDGNIWGVTPANVNITIKDQAPTITNISISVYKNDILLFRKDDFTTNFSGFCGNHLAKIKIISLPSYGILKLSDKKVDINQEITADLLEKLTYTPSKDYIGPDGFIWMGSDGTLYSANSASVSFAISENPVSWISSPGGIVTICGGVVGGVSSILGTAYTLYKCKKDNAFCFKYGKKPPIAIPLMEAQS